MPKKLIYGVMIFTLSFFIYATDSREIITNSYTDMLKVVAFYPANGTDGFFQPDQTVKLALVLQNTGSRNTEFRLNATATDFFGKTVYTLPEQKISFPVSQGKKFEISIPPLKSLGHFTITAAISQDGKKLIDTQSAFAVVEKLKERDPFFGADVGHFYPKSMEGQKLAGIGSIGIQSNNYTFTPAELEAKFKNNPLLKPVFESDFQLVGYFSPLARDLYTLGGGNQKSGKLFDERIKKGMPCFRDEDIALAYELGKRSAELMKDRIRLWIVRAEYDVKVLRPHLYGGDSYVLAETVALTRAFYQGIRAGNPNAKVAVLGMMGIDYYPGFRSSNKTNPFPLSRIILKDLNREWDFLAIDAYSSRRGDGGDGVASSAEYGLRDFLNATVELSVAHGGPALVINSERGSYCDWLDRFDSAPVKSVAHDLVRSLIISRSTACAYYSLHVLVDQWKPYFYRKGGMEQVKKDYIGGQDYGAIWRASFNEREQIVLTPRPGAAAHAVAARELAFVHPGREFRLLDIYAYTFARRDGTSLAAFWSSGKEIELAIDLPAGCSLSDMMGNRRELPAGRNVLTVGAPVLFLRVPDKLVCANSIFEKIKLVNQNPILVDGQRSSRDKIRVFVVNRDAKNRMVRVHLDHGGSAELALPPMKGLSAEIPIDPKVSGIVTGEIVCGEKTDKISFDASFTGIPKLAVTPVMNGSGTWTDKLKGGILKAPENVYPKAALMMEWGLFNNSLSDPNAEYFMAYDNSYLYFAVRMKNDQEHIQKFHGPDLWRGDSLQFVISKRNAVFPALLRSKDESTEFTNEEYNMALSLTSKGAVLYDYGRKKELSCPVSVSRNGSNTFYEVALPWSELGIVPASGSGFRFGFTIFDYRNDRQYELSFTRGISGGQDPSLLKTIIFE